MTEELEENIRHRGKAIKTMKSSSSLHKGGDDSDSDEFNSKTGERSRSLYCRSSEGEKVNLEDFQLVSIAGKGSFGKVNFCFFNNI